MFIWRPCLSDPKLCDYIDLATRLTIDDLANFHEALDLKDAIQARAREEQERNARR